MRTVAILAATLLISLIGSYLVWTSDSEPTDTEKIAVYTAAEGDVQGIEWVSGESTVLLTRKSDDKGDYIWVTHTERIDITPEPVEPVLAPDDTEASSLEEGEEPPTDGTEPTDGHNHNEATSDEEGAADTQEDEPAPTPPEPVYETRVSEFLGGVKAETLYDAFEPFMAIRSIDNSGNELDMGIDEPTATIQVTRKSGALQLTVGKETFGGRQQFLTTKDASFLIKKTDLSAFAKPAKLLETRPHPFAMKDITRVTVSQGEQQRVFVRQNASDIQKAFWSDESTPEAEDKEAETWLRKLFIVKATEHAAADIDSAALTEVFAYTVSDGDTTWDISVLKGSAEEASTLYGRTAFNRGLVVLGTKASDAVADLNQLLAPPAPAAPPEPTAPSDPAAPAE